jgi:hypothetical protein
MAKDDQSLPSRLARGSVPTKSHPSAPGRHLFSEQDQPPKSKVGRPKGAQNKLTRELRELILEAGERLGRDGKGEGGMLGYLMYLGFEVPSSYAVLLRAVLPVQVNATITHKPVKTLAEVMAELNARGLPRTLIENLRAHYEHPGEDDEPDPDAAPPAAEK